MFKQSKPTDKTEVSSLDVLKSSHDISSNNLPPKFLDNDEDSDSDGETRSNRSSNSNRAPPRSRTPSPKKPVPPPSFGLGTGYGSAGPVPPPPTPKASAAKQAKGVDERTRTLIKIERYYLLGIKLGRIPASALEQFRKENNIKCDLSDLEVKKNQVKAWALGTVDVDYEVVNMAFKGVVNVGESVCTGPMGIPEMDGFASFVTKDPKAVKLFEPILSEIAIEYGGNLPSNPFFMLGVNLFVTAHGFIEVKRAVARKTNKQDM